MSYVDDVLRMRREIRSLHKQLGDEVTDNSDLFGEREVGGKELADLQAEQRVLTQRLAVEEHRADIRERAWAELGGEENYQKPIPHKPQRPDNSDLLLTNEEMRRIEKNV